MKNVGIISVGCYLPKRVVTNFDLAKIVETSDALLIVPRERAQDVTRLVSEIEKAGREELL